MEKVFKTIVFASIVVFIAHWLFPYFDYLWVSDDGLKILSWSGYEAEIPFNSFLYWALFVAWLFTSVGLLFFFGWARTGFLLLTMAELMATPFWGYLILSPVDALLYQLLGLADGAILTLAYLSGLSGKFSSNRTRRSV